MAKNLIAVLALFFTLFCCTAQLAARSTDKRLKVVVIDTGLDLNDKRLKPYLCSEGHKDFTGEGIQDIEGHGTHVAGLITQFAKGYYCLVIVKYYSPSAANHENYIKALYYAIKLQPFIINYSGGGEGYIPVEKMLIEKHPEITFVVAAGNDGANLDKVSYYPASFTFDNVITVGNWESISKPSKSSNYGSVVDTWEIGTNCLSYLPGNKMGLLSGTSMATAVHTGKLIRNLYE